MVNTMSNIYKDAAKKTLAFKRFIQRKTEESKNPDTNIIIVLLPFELKKL
jgi:hypothetical protein